MEGNPPLKACFHGDHADCCYERHMQKVIGPNCLCSRESERKQGVERGAVVFGWGFGDLEPTRSNGLINLMQKRYGPKETYGICYPRRDSEKAC